jgi:glycosyltransferase involved in cell wall biosynthesis
MVKHSFAKALILSGCPHATVKLYRAIHLQEQMAQLGIEAEVVDWQEQALPAQVTTGVDLLVLQRTVMSANLRRLIETMHTAGKPMIFDTDDLVFEPTMIEWHHGAAQLPASEQALYVDGVARTRAALEACDAVLAASPLLVELAQRRGKPAFLHRNAVGSEMQALGDRLYAQRHAASASHHAAITPLILGYGSGTPTHDADFAVATPALVEVLTRHPQVELWLMGPLAVPAALDLFGPRIRRFPLSGWQEYLEQASRLDIMLAPLEPDNIFCRAKSEIKFVEAALLGIPTVASRIDPFEQAITPGVDGLLAGNTAEWVDALDTLICQPTDRTELGQAARRTVADRYTTTARAAQLAATLTAISQLSVTSQQSLGSVDNSIQTGGATHFSSASHLSKRVKYQQNLVSSRQSPESKIQNPKSKIQNPDPPLVLNWVVTEPYRGSGGHLGVLRMIQHLVEFGHECHVYIVPVIEMHNWSAGQIQKFVDQQIMRTGAHFHRWTGRTGRADATIATYWSTVNDVQQLPDPGRCYYLVQDFEPSFYPMGADYVLAENTYRQGFHCLTLGRWLSKFLRERYQAQADYYDFAVDHEIYWPQPQPRPPNPRVAFYARPSTPRRAYELGIEALAHVKRQYPDVEVILFGANELTMPSFAANLVGIRHPYELASLYSTCEVGLVLSLTNPSFVPLEMMACKCAVVDIRSERLEGLMIDRQTALLADPTPESIAAAILELLWDQELRSAITERAYAATQNLSWRASARQIERVLLDYASQPDERTLARRAREEDADSLLWQIQQLLARQQSSAQQVAQLEALLHRTLEEKARLAEQLRQTEAALQAARTATKNPLRTLQQQSANALAEAPVWMLDAQLLGKLPIDGVAIEQTFTARQAQLCRLELSFAPYRAETVGAVQVRLFDPSQPDQPVAEQTVLAVEIPLERPYVFVFAPQPFSTGRSYRLTLTALGDGIFAHALWRYWQAPAADVRLQRGGRPLRGQLRFQPGYLLESNAPTQPTPDHAPQSPQSLGVRAYSAGERALREGARLAGLTWQTLRVRGPLGLLREIANYLRWQVDMRLRS